MAEAGPDRPGEPHLVRGSTRAVALGQRPAGKGRDEVARQPVSHRRARRGSAASLYVLATDLCRQPRSQPCTRTLWNIDLRAVKRRKRMPVAQESSRRGFMKMLAASPLLAQLAAQGLYEKSAAAMGFDPRENVYTRLGVKTVINCRGTWTYLSGSLQFPEVRAAQTEASHHFVNMVELQRAAGRKLAELTGAESGLITSGAAGALAASTA